MSSRVTNLCVLAEDCPHSSTDIPTSQEPLSPRQIGQSVSPGVLSGLLAGPADPPFLLGPLPLVRHTAIPKPTGSLVTDLWQGWGLLDPI